MDSFDLRCESVTCIIECVPLVANEEHMNHG